MIYFDNAATTYPKPEQVYEALDRANRNFAFNAGRGEYKQSTEAFNFIEDTRKKVAFLIKRKSSEVIFTSSATESLNLIINGIGIYDGDYIYVSPFEHNAVIRPLKNMQKKIDFQIVVLPFDKDTWLPNLEQIENEFAIHHPKAIFISHISNVTGYVVPYEEIFGYGTKWNSINILDCAQSFGVETPNELNNVNYIIFAGHKSLYASFGIAGFLKMKNDELNIVKAGGTGSDSLNPDMPKEIPYRYEAGSPNIVAIAGLNASCDWVASNNIREHEIKLGSYFLDKVKNIEGVRVYLPKNCNNFGVFSIAMHGYTATELSEILEEDFNICTRAGYHCAPIVHEFIGSLENKGTTRISFSAFTTKEEVDVLLNALEEVSNEL